MKILPRNTFIVHAFFHAMLDSYGPITECYWILGHKIDVNKNEYSQYVMKEFVYQYIERYIE